MNEYTGWVVAVIMAGVAARYIWKYTKLEQSILDLKARGILKDMHRKAIKDEIRSVMEEEIAEALRGDNLKNMPDPKPKSGVKEDEDVYGDGQCPKSVTFSNPKRKPRRWLIDWITGK